MTIKNNQSYRALTIETVAEEVKHLQVFEDINQLEIIEIGDGNLNYVFRLKEVPTGKSLIVKQALPYAKVVGESWPLTLDRARVEYQSLKKAAEFVPELVPNVYAYNRELAYTVMEDLSSHVILRSGLIAGKAYPSLGEHIGTFTAQTLFHTSDFYLHPFKKKELVGDFLNPELCKITEDLVFTDPFFDHYTNDIAEQLQSAVDELWQDEALKQEVAKLKYQFLTEAEALLHGDLHTGSIFVTEDSTKVIDPEFAYVGPIGFDLGQFIANILLSYVSKESDQTTKELQTYLLDVCNETWDHFSKQFLALARTKGEYTFLQVNGVAEGFLEKVWRDLLGFAGCEVIRRTIGLAQVADLNTIENIEKQIERKKIALLLGSTLIKKRNQIVDVDQLTSLVKEIAE